MQRFLVQGPYLNPASPTAPLDGATHAVFDAFGRIAPQARVKIGTDLLAAEGGLSGSKARSPDGHPTFLASLGSLLKAAGREQNFDNNLLAWVWLRQRITRAVVNGEAEHLVEDFVDSAPPWDAVCVALLGAMTTDRRELEKEYLKYLDEPNSLKWPIK